LFNGTKPNAASGKDPGGAYQALIRNVHHVLAARSDPLGAVVCAAEALAPYVRLDLLGEQEVYLALHAAYYSRDNGRNLSQQTFDQRFKAAVNTGWPHKPGWNRVSGATQDVSLDELIDLALSQLRGSLPKLQIAS